MIYLRLQGRKNEGYSVNGNITDIDENDKHFSSFVDYIDDVTENNMLEMYYGHPSYTESAGAVYAVGRNVLVSDRIEAGRMLRSYQLSHKFIYADKDYDALIGSFGYAARVANFCTSMDEYENNEAAYAQPVYYEAVNDDLRQLAARYGITDGRYADFVFALATAAFDPYCRLYITLPENTEQETELAKRFTAALMDALPSFLKRRFGFITYFPFNDDETLNRVLPMEISCVFVKRSNRNRDNIANCEFYFDATTEQYYSVELGDKPQEFVKLIADYIFYGDRSRQELFDSIDKVFKDGRELSFDTVIAFYIRNNYESAGEFMWACRMIRSKATDAAREMFYGECLNNIRGTMPSTDPKYMRALVNAVNDPDFQSDVADEICAYYNRSDMPAGSVKAFVDSFAIPARHKEGKSYEEKSVEQFKRVFEHELFNNENYTRLATREILSLADEGVQKGYAKEDKLGNVLKAVGSFIGSSRILQQEIFQRSLFDYIQPLAFDELEVRQRKTVYDFAAQNEQLMPRFASLVYERIMSDVMCIADSEEYIASCAADIKANGGAILTGMIEPLSLRDESGTIKTNLVDRFRRERFKSELELTLKLKDVMQTSSFLHRDDSNVENYFNYFDDVYEDIKQQFMSYIIFEANNRDQMAAFITFLGEIRLRNNGDMTKCLSCFTDVVYAHVFEANTALVECERLASFINFFFGNYFWDKQGVGYEAFARRLDEYLRYLHALSDVDSVRLSEAAKQYLGVDDTTVYLKSAGGGTSGFSRLIEESSYSDLIKKSPKTMLAEYRMAANN